MKWRGDEFQSKRLTVATVVHIPARDGYWAESLDVLDVCLKSLRENTGEPFDLMVLDNASCEGVQDYLLELRRCQVIDYLILARHNMRKLGAVKFLLGSAPGEIVTYTDSDVYFTQGWFEATLAVLEAFPEAGQVTALPTGDKTGDYCSATLKGAEANSSVSIEEGLDLIPEKYLRAHASSLGLPWEQYQRRMAGKKQMKVSRGGVSAFASAQDFQYTTTRMAIAQVQPLGDPGDEYYDGLYSPVVEAAVDSAGLWRLSTEGYFAHHIGNRLPKTEALEMVFPTKTTVGIASTQSVDAPRINGIRANRYFRKALKIVNSWTYRMLFDD